MGFFYPLHSFKNTAVLISLTDWLTLKDRICTYYQSTFAKSFYSDWEENSKKSLSNLEVEYLGVKYATSYYDLDDRTAFVGCVIDKFAAYSRTNPIAAFNDIERCGALDFIIYAWWALHTDITDSLCTTDIPKWISHFKKYGTVDPEIVFDGDAEKGPVKTR